MGEKKASQAGQINIFTNQVETFVKGRDEMNLAEFPIAVVAESAQAGQLTLQFSDSIKDQASGEIIDRSVTVHGTEEWGLPAAQDDEVMFGLLQLCYLADWPKRFRFTRYQLCKLLRWSVGGASYRRIYRALHRLSTTSYNYRYAWRDRANQEWIPSQVFSYIQALKIHEAEKPTDSGLCEVTWSDDFFRSLDAGNLKTINFDLFVSLKRSISKRLYRFLDKRFGLGQTLVVYDLKTLAFEKVGISRNYKDISQVKRKLLPAIRELEKANYIAVLPTSKRFQKVVASGWKVQFKRYTAQADLNLPTSAASKTEHRLLHHGVSQKAAAILCTEKPKEFLDLQIEILEYNQAVGKGPENSGAWLAAACRGEGYSPPAGFISKEERGAQEAAENAKADEMARRAGEAQKTAEKEREATERAIREFLSDECSDELRKQFQDRVAAIKTKLGLGDRFDAKAHLKLVAADHLLKERRITQKQRELL